MDLRASIASCLDDRVVSAVDAWGGFTPGVAARVDLARSQSVFVKVAGVAFAPQVCDIYRREAAVMRELPERVPAPRLLHVLDHGDWVALVLTYVAGTLPAQPWADTELDLVLAAVADLGATLTPPPISAPRLIDDWADDFTGWRRLEDSAGRIGSVSPWAAAHLSQLAELESGWDQVADGDTLLHGDLRADNILINGEQVVFLDWPNVCVGAPWVDLLFMLPSVMLASPRDPNAIIATHPVTAGVLGSNVDAVLAAIAGFFASNSLEPDPPGLPTVREFQAQQARTSLRWLKSRVNW
jgi:aminoglycoside phosphotransferase (APT) family kinase protein